MLSAVLLYITFKNKEEKSKSLLLAIIWIINPINIIWCTFSAPITIVNFFFILCSCIFELREKKRKNDIAYIVITLILGIVLGIANEFRPIFIVFIIALVLYDLYKMISEKNKKVIVSLISIFILLMTYFTICKLGNIYIQKIIGQEIAKSSGWTLYLGANTNSKGSWNIVDAQEFNEECNKIPFSAERIQNEFKEKAVYRIKQNGIRANVKLIIDKFETLTANMALYSKEQVWNMQNETKNEFIEKTIEFSAKLFVFSLILSNLLVVVSQKNKESLYMYILLCMGLIASHLFVEVSSRYSIHIIIPLSIIGVTSFYNILKYKDEEEK